jgi:hypothetical protein
MLSDHAYSGLVGVGPNLRLTHQNLLRAGLWLNLHIVIVAMNDGARTSKLVSVNAA